MLGLALIAQNTGWKINVRDRALQNFKFNQYNHTAKQYQAQWRNPCDPVVFPLLLFRELPLSVLVQDFTGAIDFEDISDKMVRFLYKMSMKNASDTPYAGETGGRLLVFELPISDLGH